VSIPVLSARGLGRLRIAVGVSLIWLLAREAPLAMPLELHRAYSPLSDLAFIHWIAASQPLLTFTHGLAIAAAVLFTIGFYTRAAYAVMVSALLVTRLTTLHSSGTHDWDCPMAILLALLAVPWGDGISVDQWRSPSPIPPDTTSPRYGLALWAPGVVMGLAFAAAAYAKLSTSGLEWITGGAVRYHFMEDSDAAATTWGLWVAGQPMVAVAVSGAAVLFEATWVFANGLRGPLLRLAAGAAALGLFLGFWAFQGAFWLPWVGWLLVWLPWDGWRPLRSARLSGTPAVVTAVVVAVQVFASVTYTEIEPVMSNYPMYSGTYASTADFEHLRRRKFRQLHARVGDTAVAIPADDEEELFDAVASSDPAAAARIGALVARLCDGTGGPALDITAERTRFDWSSATPQRRIESFAHTFPCPPPGAEALPAGRVPAQ